jgi:hypothetical protein
MNNAHIPQASSTKNGIGKLSRRNCWNLLINIYKRHRFPPDIIRYGEQWIKMVKSLMYPQAECDGVAHRELTSDSNAYFYYSENT